MNSHLSPDHPVRKHPYTTTNAGVKIFAPRNFRVCEFRASDMMDGLSKICRYNGQINRFYSVAEHSVLVSLYAEAEGDIEAMYPALLHDAHEYLSGDIPTPQKDMVKGLKAFEDGYEMVVREALDLPGPDDSVWERVALYDHQILHRELAVLREIMPTWFDPDIERIVPEHIQPVGYEWVEARAFFRQRFRLLGGIE